MQKRFPNTREFEGYFHASKTLLAHFHHVCNGSAPLRLAWRDPQTTAIAKMSEDQIEFMEISQSLIDTSSKLVAAVIPWAV
jgi:hypothetical protein